MQHMDYMRIVLAMNWQMIGYMMVIIYIAAIEYFRGSKKAALIDGCNETDD